MTTDAPPIEFDEIVARLRKNPLLLTSLSSAQLNRLPAELRQRAFFSARVLNAQILQGFKDAVDAIVSGTSNAATQRLKLKDLLDAIGYVPNEGEEGSLKDLGSNARLNVMLNTNTDLLRGWGQWTQGNSEGGLIAFPAQELIRVAERRVPREWEDIWDEAADALGDATTATDSSSGRLIAMKNDPIWLEISDFGLPYPPFKFNSGMGVEDVSYEEAVDAGVMDENDDPIPPPALGINDGYESSIEGLSADLLSALVADMQGLAEIVGNKLVLKSAPTPAPVRQIANARLAALDGLFPAFTLRDAAEGRLALMNAYNPDEPRDERGRWASGADVGRKYGIKPWTRLNIGATEKMLGETGHTIEGSKAQPGDDGKWRTTFTIATPDGRKIERTAKQIHEFLLGQRNAL